MPKTLTRRVPPPILKPRSEHRDLATISPQPPTEHRDPPLPIRDKSSRNPAKTRDKLSLAQAIDYRDLTPTQQAKWDAGMYGCIHLRTDVKKPYYCVRWTDPTTKSRRSTKLAHTWDEATAKLRELTGYQD